MTFMTCASIILFFFFFFNDTATTEIYTLSLHDALPISLGWRDVRLVRGDLDDAAALAEGCAGAELVFHLAGRISARDVREFMSANRDGTASVLEAASLQPPQRFVLVSSLAAGGPTTPGHPIDEARR